MKTKPRKSDEKNLLLKVRGLTVERGDTRILDSVDWTMRHGQNWVILGPNGCGKTSLLKSLTGYLTPSDGDIMLLGQIYRESDWRDLRLKVGIVTNAIQSGVPNGETALETVISGKYAQLDLWMKPRRKDSQEALKLLEFVGMSGLEKRLWVQLSQGERQRVLIARALMARPSLLILDEPCSGLDPVAREQFLKFIEILARNPKAPAMILVTHHVEEITPSFTHALLLKSGRVAAEGEIKDVLTSAQLSRIFSASIFLRKNKGQYSLHLKKTEGKNFGRN